VRKWRKNPKSKPIFRGPVHPMKKINHIKLLQKIGRIRIYGLNSNLDPFWMD
jgi:hypothetical protein